MEKKEYTAPKAESIAFVKADVITASGYLFDWNLPSVDLGGDGFVWDENGQVLKM